MGIKLLHSDIVAKLRKPGKDILLSMTEQNMDLTHMAIGVSGEAGELLDAIKKVTIYNKEIDRKNVIEELGDIEFYLAGIRQCLGITRKATLEANVHKFSVRYKDFKYSDKQAQDRADKQ